MLHASIPVSHTFQFSHRFASKGGQIYCKTQPSSIHRLRNIILGKGSKTRSMENFHDDVCVAVVVDIVGVVDQDQVADLSIVFCSSLSKIF